MSEHVRVAITATSAIYCAGLASVLQAVDSAISVVGATTSAPRLTALTREHEADVAVIVRPSEYPRGALDALPNDLPLLVLGNGATDIAAVGQRRVAFARIDDPPPSIAARVRAIVADARPRRPGRSASRVVAGVRVTARERDLAQLVADGLSNAEIASTLGLAQQTIKNQLSAFMAKTGTQSRLQLCRWVMHHGVVAGTHVSGPDVTSTVASVKAS